MEGDIAAYDPSNSIRGAAATDTDDEEPTSQANETGRNQNEGSEIGISKMYPKHGLVYSTHGDIYQLKLLMLFLKRGINLGYSFKLATEWAAAEKFDDVVFQNEENGKNVLRFLQAKHKQKDNKKITVRDLLKEDGEFSLPMYFISYRKIIQKPEFRGDDGKIFLRDFVICTNIDLEEELRNCFEHLEDEDTILSFKGIQSKRLKFKLDKFSQKDDLIFKLQQTSECVRLAKKLAEYVSKKKPLDLKNDLLKTYHNALTKQVIDVKKRKFKNSFLQGNREIQSFRNAFKEAYLISEKKLELDDSNFWQTMEKIKLEMSINFQNEFELNTNPLITGVEGFAQAIANKIGDVKDGVVTVDKRQKVINENIQHLGGHVLIKRNNTEKDEYCLSSAFLDNNTQLPGNLGEFRDLLNKNLQQGTDWKTYKFHISNFKTCEENLLQSHQEEQIPNDVIPDEVINEFFEKLVLAVNQPNEILLGSIIEFEMGEDKVFNLVDSEFIASKFQKDILDWMKDKEGKFLTHEDGKKFFENCREKISKLMLTGLTLEYRAKIENLGIKFKKEPSGLRNFLNQNESYFLCLVNPHETVLTSIKVNDFLRGIHEFNKYDSHIFIRLRSLIRTLDRVLESFKPPGGCNLLVIECKVRKKSADEMASQLYTLFLHLSDVINDSNRNSSENYPIKKIILITQENEPLAVGLKNYFSQEYRSKHDEQDEEKDEGNSFRDLTVDSQKKFENDGKIIFQGEIISLGSIIIDNEVKEFIDGEVLSKLIDNKAIRLGKVLTDFKYDNIKAYYIDQTLECEVSKVNKNFKKESKFFVIEDETPQQKPREDQEIVLVSDKLDFEAECNNYRKQNNIHWLTKDYTWKKSKGDLFQLDKFMYESVRKLELNDITNIQDTMVIVMGNPGMGKSSLLNHFAVETKKLNPSSLWIIRVNLLDYSAELREKLKEVEKEADVLKFLYRIAGFQLFQEGKERTVGEKKQMAENLISTLTITEGKINVNREIVQGLDLLEIELFNVFYSQGRIALLFDGLDEISPNYTEKVIKLLKAIVKQKKIHRIWITSRPYNSLKKVLQDQFNSLTCSLSPFLPNQQKLFFKRFWNARYKSDFDEHRSEIFINELLGKFSKPIGQSDFMSTPLHASMVAEIFKTEFKEFYDSGFDNLSDEQKQKVENKDLSSLYEEFIEIKFYEILIGEKNPVDTAKPLWNNKLKKDYKELIKNHEMLSVYAIFEGKLLSEKEREIVYDLIKKIKQGKEKTGIISGIIKKRPDFVHPTFAEYFAAGYIWEKFKLIEFDKFKADRIENIVTENLIKDDRIQVCDFIHLRAKNDFGSGQAILSDKEAKLKSLFERLVNETHPYGPYKKKNTKESSKLLWGVIEFSLNDKNNRNAIKSVPITDEKKLQIVCVCAEKGYENIARLLKIKSECFKEYLKVDKWHFSPLYLAAEHDHLEMIKILKNNFSYDTTWKDKDNNTLLQNILSVTINFNALRSCLKLGIINVSTTYEDFNVVKSPLVYCLVRDAPKDVIKLLIEETDANFVKVLNRSRDKDLTFLFASLLRYDEEIATLLIEKGFDFSQAINRLLFEFRHESLISPIKSVKDAHFGRPTFSSNEEFLNFYSRIEILLKSGCGFNCYDNQYELTTLQYAGQIYNVRCLLGEISNPEKYDGNSIRDLILKLIIDSKLYGLSKGLFLSPNNKDGSGNYGRYGNLLEAVPLLPDFFLDICLPNIQEDITNLRTYITNAREEIEGFKHYADSKTYNNILTGYKEMLEFEELKEAECRYDNLSEFVKKLLEQVLKLFIRQGYEINVALEEILEDLSKFEDIINKISECQQNGKVIYETEKLLYVLDIKDVDINDEALQKWNSEIYKNKGIQLLIDIWSYLNHIGKNKIMETIKLTSEFFADLSLKIFKLFDGLNCSYNSLIDAIRNSQEINELLGNLSQPDYIKAIINAQDCNYGSPLHYAVYKCDINTIEILLEKGANPNLAWETEYLEEDEKEQSGESTLNHNLETERVQDSLPKDYANLTPLHIAALKGNKKIVESLLKNGGNVNYEDKWGRTPLHYAASSTDSGALGVTELLIENGANVNANVKYNMFATYSNMCGTPLHIATDSGAYQVADLLIRNGAVVDSEDDDYI